MPKNKGILKADAKPRRRCTAKAKPHKAETCATSGGSRPQAPRGLKAQLLGDRGSWLYGAFLMSGSHVVAELMAHAGYGFLVVDLEHGASSCESTALHMMQAVAAVRVPVLVRVALNRPELIKKALDLGPAGIIVPLVDCLKEAEAAVAACRYPPRGHRGVAFPLVRASAWGMDAGYLQEAEDRCLLLCQVETPRAVREIGPILAADGVDGVFVGPLDLSASLGHLGDVGHPDVRRALGSVEAAARLRPEKVLAGFAAGRPVAKMREAGYRLIACSADVALLRDAARRDVQASLLGTG